MGKIEDIDKQELAIGFFEELARPPIWAPYRKVWNEKRQKYDKILSRDERYNLSTAVPGDWTNLTQALEDAAKVNFPGVGLVMTGGISNGDLTLLGFDFDDITPEWVPPLKTYAEKSPSGKGARMFAWAKTDWADQFQDTLNCKPPNCEHCEVYLGTAPRFLTVTFDAIQLEAITTLKGMDLLAIEDWGMHLREAEKPQAPPPSLDAGTPFDWHRLGLTREQRHLVEGTGNINRSDILYGLIPKAADDGNSRGDVLASMMETPALWQFCLDHRSGNPDKAVQYAKDQINKAWGNSTTGKREALIGFNAGWKKDGTVGNTKTDDLKFPIQIFDKAPGLVGEIAKWILGASRAPREEFAYAAALSTMACLVGPSCTVGDGKLNLYIALVGGTGTGKTEAMKAGLKLVSATDAKDSVSDFPASEAALRRQLCVNPNVLIRVDELAHKFESFKGDSSNGSGLSRAILEAYDGDRMPPKPYADDKKSLPAVENPFVQILGGTTSKIWEVLQTKHLEDGTLNRFIFVSLPDDPEYSDNPAPSIALEKPLKDKLNAFFRAGRMNDLIGDVPGFGRHIEYAPEVNAALSALGPELFKKQQGEYGPLYSRFVLHVGKIASLLAVGDGREVVGMTDYQQALAFMTWSVETTLRKVSGALAGSDFERKTKRIARKLESAKGKKMNMRDLYRFMGCSRKEMEALIDALELSGTVSTDDEDWVSLLG